MKSTLGGTLSESGLEVLEYPDIPSLAVRANDGGNYILAIHSGMSEESTLDVAKEIIREKHLHPLHLLLFGHAVDEVGPVITQYFTNLSLTPLPYARDDVRRAIHAAKDVPRHSTNADEARLNVTMELAEELDNVPQQLVPELRRATVAAKPTGGDQYGATISIEYLSANGMMPTNPKVAELTSSVTEKAGEWGKAHLCRTVFVSCKLFEAAGLDAGKAELLKGAAFLSSWSFNEKDSKLRRENFVEEGKEDVRRDLCSKVKDSAFKVAVDLQLPELGMVLSTLGKLIGQEQEVSSDDASVVASILMVADLVDRVCYQSGRWEGRNAYHLMRRLKSGGIDGIHPTVLVCLIRFLSEAITSHASLALLPRELRTDPELRKQLSELRELPISDDEERVTISALTPGMVLSKPLVAFDGKKILSEGIVLDQDLVYRLWQLAAVRPLNPAVIRREEKTAPL